MITVLHINLHNYTMTNWIIRIGDGKHFFSSTENVWGFNSRNSYFLRDARPNDKLFFVMRGTKCTICAYAIFKGFRYRSNLTPNNQYYNWIYHDESDGGRWKNSKWDVELIYDHYYDLRNNVDNIQLCTGINTNMPNGIIVPKIINSCNFNFNAVIEYVENCKIYDFLKSF